MNARVIRTALLALVLIEMAVHAVSVGGHVVHIEYGNLAINKWFACEVAVFAIIFFCGESLH